MAIPIHGDPRLRLGRCRRFALAVEDGTTYCGKQLLQAAATGSRRRVLDDWLASALHPGLDEYVTSFLTLWTVLISTS